MIRHVLSVGAALALSGCVGPIGPHGSPPQLAPPATQSVPKTFQWMGSAEAAALSRQAYGALTSYTLDQVAARNRGGAVSGMILADGASLDAPRFQACGSKPLAIVLDMDESAILNTGANYDSARRGDPPFDAGRWDAWEEGDVGLVDPVPGAVEALAAVRAAGVTPIFISNRQTRFGALTAEALAGVGLGLPVAGETMFLRDAGSGKDPRRAIVAARWCVVAMVGDQLGDFSDLFNAQGLAPADRRSLAQSPALVGLWGRGWFLMPNPLYGTGVTGTLDQVFPDHRWAGPAAKETK